MILPVEAWMNLRRYQPLRAAGATWREIADEVGLDWRTVKRYLSTDAPSGPPRAPSRRGCVTRKIDALTPVVDAWLAADPQLKASVIHEPSPGFAWRIISTAYPGGAEMATGLATPPESRASFHWL